MRSARRAEHSLDSDSPGGNGVRVTYSGVNDLTSLREVTTCSRWQVSVNAKRNDYA